MSNSERRQILNRYRGNAIAVGLLLIACTATSILSAVPPGLGARPV
jgi:hypothetical protein